MCQRIFIAILLLFSIFAFNNDVANAERITLTATGSHILGDDDSPQKGRDEARNEAKRAVSEQAGTYIESYTEVRNASLTVDEIKTLSANIVRILDEKESRSMVGGCMKVSVTITAEVDTVNIDPQAILMKRQYKKTTLYPETIFPAKSITIPTRTPEHNYDNIITNRGQTTEQTGGQLKPKSQRLK